MDYNYTEEPNIRGLLL